MSITNANIIAHAIEPKLKSLPSHSSSHSIIFPAMVTSMFHHAIQFPMSRKFRKAPSLALIVFASSLAITVTVNLFLFSWRCDLNSEQPSLIVPVVPAAHAVTPYQTNLTLAAPRDNGPAAPVSSEAAPTDFILDTVKGRITFPKPVSRSVIAKILEHMKLKSGFQVGVKQGVFSKEILQQWPTCQYFFLVDLWSNPNNYFGEKVLDSTLEQHKRDAFENTSPWKEKILHCQNFSTACAANVKEDSFDFGYIDARHDFKSVYEDLEAWYPKIRTGGVLSGHDYMSALEVRLSDGIDWTHNFDNTKDYSLQAAKGAVNMFFAARGQYVEPCSPFPSFSSWVVYKAAPGMSQPNDLLHFIDLKCFIESNCDYISEKFAYTVRAWETLNPRFSVLVWTRETLSWFLKEEVEKYNTTYRNDPLAYGDMLKLKLIHRFGGTFIQESITPIQGLQSYVDQVRESTGGPAAFCEDVAESGEGPFTNDCNRVSRFLISGKKGDKKILELAEKHEREFSQGFRNEEESLEVSDRVLGSNEFNIFKTKAPFPCNSFSIGAECIAQVHYE